jgi:hypothetical protein
MSADKAKRGEADDGLRRRSTRLGAGAAGAGGGTLLVLMANNLPSTHPWRSWLVLLAPSASVAVSALYTWATSSLDQYFRKRELRTLIQQAKATLQDALASSSTSSDHRQQLTKELEQLELLLVQTDMEKIKNLRMYR